MTNGYFLIMISGTTDQTSGQARDFPQPTFSLYLLIRQSSAINVEEVKTNNGFWKRTRKSYVVGGKESESE